jgi:N-acetylmuramoyl-L-alanine amidase
MQFSFLNFWALILITLIPLSCTGQKTALDRISSAERGDNRGHVIRFHFAEPSNSFEFSQPQTNLIQLELQGSNIDTAGIRLDDESDILEKVAFYPIQGGMGVDFFLKKEAFYKAAAYPDRSSNDILVGLTKADPQVLTEYTQSMEMFEWSDAPPVESSALADSKKDADEDQFSSVDTTYQRIKDKIKFDVVVLDAGHGGHDTGAIGRNGTYEKDVVLDIAKKVGGYIEENMPGVKVVYTRDDDTFIDLYERGPIANRAEGDLFVSIHANAARSSQAHGTETFFLGLERSESALKVMQRENKVVNLDNGEKEKKLTQEDLIIYELANSGYIANSERLAGMVQDQFKNRANRRSRGVKQGRLVVLYHASMPAILVETGFISNPSEQEYLTSDYGQNIMASAIFRSIRNYKEDFERSQHIGSE